MLHAFCAAWMDGCLSLGISQASLLQGACGWDTQVVVKLHPPEPADDSGRVQCIKAQHKEAFETPLGWVFH